MTREEAIKTLRGKAWSRFSDKWDEALDMAIEALEQEPCEDCISRQATVRKLCKVADFMNEKREGLGSPYIMAALFIQDNKDEFPPVTPKEKTGHWILQPSNKEQGERDFIWWKCSECGQVIFSETEKDRREYHAYCGRCGARMVSDRKVRIRRIENE